ncbi:hypothetical protein [Vibrio phage RYC]|nr:hypothetical protein [Vibrio phage RYC]
MDTNDKLLSNMLHTTLIAPKCLRYGVCNILPPKLRNRFLDICELSPNFSQCRNFPVTCNAGVQSGVVAWHKWVKHSEAMYDKNHPYGKARLDMICFVIGYLHKPWYSKLWTHLTYKNNRP